MQQTVIGRGWVGGDKDDEEEEYDGCGKVTGKVASAPAKWRGLCGCIVLCIQWKRNAAMDAATQWGTKTTKMARDDVRLPGQRDTGQKN